MRCFLITKKQIVAVTTTFVILIAVTFLSVNVFASQQLKMPICSVDTEQKQVAIAVAVLEECSNVDEIISVLDNYSVKATFFVVGEWVENNTNELNKIAVAGHQIQNMSDTYVNMTQITTEEMIDELKSCNKKVANATGQTPILFKFPEDDFNNEGIEATESIGMYPIKFKVFFNDYCESENTIEISQKVVSQIDKGDIVMFNSDCVQTCSVLDLTINNLASEGYSFSFISDMIFKDNYIVDENGKQIEQ